MLILSPISATPIPCGASITTSSWICITIQHPTASRICIASHKKSRLIAAERKEFSGRAEAFLDVLTGEMRRIYDLYDEGKSQYEIAAIIGKPQDTVHRRL
jgi:DNA-directed RNA polymerase specialized sigma24 family protein